MQMHSCNTAWQDDLQQKDQPLHLTSPATRAEGMNYEEGRGSAVKRVIIMRSIRPRHAGALCLVVTSPH